MLKDKEEHVIKIAREGNDHMLVLGSSGQGKTFFLCRMLEEYCREKKRTLILDFSGSYSDKELEKKNFKFKYRIGRFRLTEDNLCWNMRVDNDKTFKKDIKDALVETLKIKSYFQIKLLEEAIDKTMAESKQFGIPDIIKTLEDMLYEEEEETVVGNKDNIGRLLTRLYPYEDTGNFTVKRGITPDSRIKRITIIDLSYFPEGQRKFMTELILSILWRELYRNQYSNQCDILILDEMQFLTMKEGRTLPNMLRESRKRNVEVVLSTQFLSNYGAGEIAALQQADTKMIFRPTPEDCSHMAKIINPKEKVWGEILRSLRRGQAVLKGFYQIDGRSKVVADPIIVSIEE